MLGDFYTIMDTPSDERHKWVKEAFHAAVPSRRFLVTDSGLPGLGPTDTRPDDGSYFSNTRTHICLGLLFVLGDPRPPLL